MQILKETFSKNNNKIQLIEVECGKQSRVGFPHHQKKTVLVIGVVHGEEPQGKFLIENYLSSLKDNQHIFANKMLFIPCLNPDGMAQNKRQNSNGVDLNRNFPTKNWALVDKNSEYFGGESPASEIETKLVIEIVEEFSPDLILTIHAPYKVVNYDGPAKNIAEKISEIIGYPATSDIGYPTPGSFGNYIGVERNIPIITLELDEEIDVKNFVDPMSKVLDYLSII